MLKDRDFHLDNVFGIVTQQKNETIQSIVPADHLLPPDQRVIDQPTTTPNVETTELKKSLESNISNLDILYAKVEQVVESHIEVCTEFNRGRDVEALAGLVKSLVDLSKESRETKSKMFEVPKQDKGNGIPTQTNIGSQQVIQIGSMRELNDLLKIQKNSPQDK